MKKILLPTDGSENSEKAIEVGLDLAKKYNAPATVLYVVPQETIVKMAARRELWPTDDIAKKIEKAIREAAEKEAKTTIERAKDIAQKQGTRVDTKIRKGDPAKEIIEEAKEGNYDFIVMGTRGLSSTKRFLLGSVSSKVTQYAPCSVSVIR